MATIERTITLNIRKELMKPPLYRRAKKAISALKTQLARHMNVAEEKVKLGTHLNLKIWEHGIKRPLHKITILAKKDDKGTVTAELPSIPQKKQNARMTKEKEKQAKKEKKNADKTLPEPAGQDKTGNAQPSAKE